MALAQAQLLSVKSLSGGSVSPFDGWSAQSYWIGQKVSLREGDAVDYYVFRTFDTGVIVNSSTGDDQTLNVAMPATDESYRLVEASVVEGLVWRVTIVQFESLSKQSLPAGPARIDDDRVVYDGGDLSDPDEYKILARFVGQVANAQSDGVTSSLDLGPSLNPIGSQVPPRKFVSSLVGAPLRL